jgi:protoporphyrinogen oxidase
MEKRIVIIGAGPTGLGAAYRLKELGYGNWAIFEKEDYVGGLAASVKDEQGFTWDKGGHVLFSHYKYFDHLVQKLLEGDYLEHMRQAYVYFMDKWIPYPFQNNIRYLPNELILECIWGLVQAREAKKGSSNFQEWILSTFGPGIARHFMLPQNQKSWAYPLKKMGKDWIAERISVVDLKRILKNIISDKDDASWGPNNTFKFPLHGGTGGLFSRFKPLIEGRLHLGKKICKIDIKKKEISLSDGKKESYDILINTSRLNQFVKMAFPSKAELLKAAALLRHSGSVVVGVGLAGKCKSSKCWMYFPQKDVAPYRITYFSNYSKFNVPRHNLYWSLLCETTYSKHKKVNKPKIIEQTIKGLLSTKLITNNDRKNIASTHLIDIDYAYPIPTIKRDRALKAINSVLEKNDIYSRGRFGAWRYEVGNMDHSCMQGVEIVERIVLNKKETTFNAK